MSIFHRFRQNRKLARLQRERAQVDIDYKKYIAELKAKGLSEEDATSQAGGMFKGDFRATHANVIAFQSDRLIEEAEKLQVMLPSDEEHWTMLKYAPHRHLSEEGQEILKIKIREEKSARREALGFWFNVVTVILSLIVAIIALLK